MRWLVLLLVSASAFADDAVKQLAVGFTTLRLLHEKHIINDAEYQSALRDLGESIGAQADESTTFMVSRFSATLYGFVEFYGIWDSTESLSDVPGNAQIKRDGTYAGDHGRFTMGVRNSRIGFRLRAPEWHRIRASALLEMDFLGSTGSIGYDQSYKITENAYFSSPVFRLRHGYFRVETPIVDFLVGQTWQLFGWQPIFHPNTAEIQGVPGQLYSRTAQLRIGKTIKTSAITLEIAAAIMRPPSRDSQVPEGQAGVRFAINKWTSTQTIGGTGKTLAPLSVAVTCDVRYFELPQFAANPPSSPTVKLTGWGVAADAFVPLIPARKENLGNSLSLNGEYAWGLGTADLYSQLSGGVSNSLLPPDAKGNLQTYSPAVDPALLDFSGDGRAHLIEWRSYLVGLQYYFPRLNGRLSVSANYSHLESSNAQDFGAPTTVRKWLDWADACIFGDITPAVRLGLEYSWFNDHYADGHSAVNHRAQLSAFYLF
jgi:hypothetical protein